VSIQKEPPTLQDYRNILISKDIADQDWKEVIEKATQNGLDGDKVKKMIDVFAAMAKNL